MRVFIFGAGYSGQAIAERLRDVADTIVGTTRSAGSGANLAAKGIVPRLFDGVLTPEIEADLFEATHLVLSISPDNGGDPVLPLLRGDLSRLMPRLSWIGYLSTVGVYGDHGGAWVDEDTICRPVSRRSKARCAAEAEWVSIGKSHDVAVALLRLSGIYGPGRNAFVNLEKGTARRLVKAGQVFNRIHVADIAGAARFLAKRNLGGIWNVTDDKPAPPQDVVAFAAELMGIAPPPELNFEEADLSPMARSFYGENKRVSNARIRAAGYRFQYPDYKCALRAMWENGDWKKSVVPS